MRTLEMNPAQKQDAGPNFLDNIDYIDFYVGNTCQAAYYYRNAFGLTPIAYCSLETGARDRVSIVVQQENIRLALTSALGPNNPIADHLNIHGDGVKDIAFTVKDTMLAVEQTVSRGARLISEPEVIEDDLGQVIKATVAGCGNIVHSFIERHGYEGSFLPRYMPIETQKPAAGSSMLAVDHVAFGVEPGKLDEWVEFYTRVFGFHVSHQEDVSTEYSGMNSKVIQSSDGRIKFPIVEPAPGKRKSQVAEYIEFHRGSGAQHAALLSDNIIETVRTLRANGIEFLSVPGTYYGRLEERVGEIDEDIDELRALNILVDRDKSGYLMQIFSKPLQSRPTFFLEVIQRKGAEGFGGGNIKALFEAVEREQARRGTL